MAIGEVIQGIAVAAAGAAEKIKLSMKGLPKHIAITIEEPASAYLKDIVFTAAKLGIPVVSFQLLHRNYEIEDVDWLAQFFNDISSWGFLQENQFKVSVLGKWYDLPSRLVEPIKKVLEDTKDYDRFFLNFCINYNGQEEIVDACRLIARQVEAGKLNPEGIDKSTIKENTYSSFFLPPELIIKTGFEKKLCGFMLWDSADSKICFAEKPWHEFTRADFLKAIEWWQRA
jgi:undecaprenyl diphosphate synthase